MARQASCAIVNNKIVALRDNDMLLAIMCTLKRAIDANCMHYTSSVDSEFKLYNV